MNVSLFNFISEGTRRNAKYCHLFDYTRENQLTGENIASLNIHSGFLISSLETRRTKRSKNDIQSEGSMDGIKRKRVTCVVNPLNQIPVA